MKKIKELWEKLSGLYYEKNYTNAKATGCCVLCRRPAKEFRDVAVKLEYSISPLCQNCQDKYFNGR